MLYLIQDTNFVTNALMNASRLSKPRELVQLRWKRSTNSDLLNKLKREKGGRDLVHKHPVLRSGRFAPVPRP